MFGYVYQNTNGPNHVSVWKIQSFLLNEICTVILWQDYSCLAGKKLNIHPMWKILMKDVDLGEPTSFLDHVYLGCTQTRLQNKKRYCGQLQRLTCLNPGSQLEGQNNCFFSAKIPKQTFPLGPVIWQVMQRKCVERYCEFANKSTQQLYKVASPMIDYHQFKEEEMKSVGEVSKVCAQIVLKCMSLARIGRPDILRSVNKLARAITKWTEACGKR